MQANFSDSQAFRSTQQSKIYNFIHHKVAKTITKYTTVEQWTMGTEKL